MRDGLQHPVEAVGVPGFDFHEMLCDGSPFGVGDDETAGAQFGFDPAGVGGVDGDGPDLAAHPPGARHVGEAFGHCVGVRPHQPAGAELDAAEVANDHGDHVGEAGADEDVEHRAAGRAGGLAVVGGPLDAVGSGHLVDVGRAVVAGIGVLRPGQCDEVAGFVAVVGTPDPRDEA